MTGVTGVFFHPEYRGPDWDIIGNKFDRFPGVMADGLALPNVRLVEPQPVSDDLLLKVHSLRYLTGVRKVWYYRGAALTVGGCVEAGEMMAKGEIANALVFSVAAGHHAGTDSAWGGTYLSCMGPTTVRLREILPGCRIAILDTDAHHGDGTREIFFEDREVLHVCFCSYDNVDASGTKIDVDVGFRSTDEEYLAAVRKNFIARLIDFRPFAVFHNLGHDTCRGDYGDRGLSRDFFPHLVREVLEAARDVCEGRYCIITHGGSRADVAEYIFPRILKVLAGSE